MKIFLFLLVSLSPLISQASIKMAITVDDLPTHGELAPGTSREDVAKKMLSVFKKHRVPEVYGFINAGKVEQQGQPLEVIRLWVEAGYPLGNHTYLHKSLNESTVEEYLKAVADNEPMLKRMNGEMNWRYFRYPYLHEGNTPERRNGARKGILERGYQIAQVTVDFNDWAWNDPYARCAQKKDKAAIKWMRETYAQNAADHLDRAEVISKALFSRSIPHILLLHVGEFTAETLDQLLTAYKKKGVTFISLTEAMKDEIYALDPGVVGPWGSEFTYQIMKSRGLSLGDVGLERYDGYPGKKLAEICR